MADSSVGDSELSASGWQMHTSKRTGLPYWFNVLTGESRYDAPPSFVHAGTVPQASPTLPTAIDASNAVQAVNRVSSDTTRASASTAFMPHASRAPPAMAAALPAAAASAPAAAGAGTGALNPRLTVSAGMSS
ncbi:hypothetical protein EON66_02825, partial [archaeon]